MAKIPKSAQKEIPQKCKICEKKFISKECLVNHIEKKHSDEIPKGWSASRYENYLRTGKTHGNCVVCKKETSWNETTWKYSRLCDDPKCRKAISKEADKNMIGKYGKTTLLNDADHQRKMIYSKKNSGTYYWYEDTAKKYPMHYASSVEKQFLEMLDNFLELDPSDVMSPSPNTYTYKYEGDTHLYIPDVYIVSLNLEIELKEPKNNQNMHPKIQAVDKVKEKLKDELMDSIEFVNYIKVNGSDYTEFFEIFSYLKSKNEYVNKNRLDTESVIESMNDMEFDDNFLNDIFGDMFEEPVTEGRRNSPHFTAINLGATYSIEKDILNPGLNYNRSIFELEQEIDNCNSLQNAKAIKNAITLLRRHLKKVKSNKDKSELHFEADRALKELNKLDNRLYIKMSEIKKSGGVKYHTYNPEDNFSDFQDTYQVEQIQESEIIGIKNGEEYKPVLILLTYTGSRMARLIKTVTDGTFSHASLSLDTNMQNMCSFNGHGFVDESILCGEISNPEGKYAVYMYLASPIEYSTINNIIGEFHANQKKLRYSIIGLVNYLFGRETTYKGEWFCSEFVSYVLSMANPKIFKKHHSLYSPDDLTNVRKFIKVDEGKTMDYDSRKVDKKISDILKRKGCEDVIIKS